MRSTVIAPSQELEYVRTLLQARWPQAHVALSPQHVPASVGTYALLLRLNSLRRIRVGQLGEFTSPRGWYIYVGSAYGPGGLAARLGRHWRGPRVRHWHIDYFRAFAQPVLAWWNDDPAMSECDWAQAAGRIDGVEIIAPRFGASDCHCDSHLFRLPPPLE